MAGDRQPVAGPPQHRREDPRQLAHHRRRLGAVADEQRLVLSALTGLDHGPDMGQLLPLSLRNPHPEISFSALWGKVWYESYDKPAYVWQSTAATTDFEPKLSLAPLAFGTLKAAFYAMLLAAQSQLRQGVKFHNGADFTAEDVVFSFSDERLFAGTRRRCGGGSRGGSSGSAGLAIARGVGFGWLVIGGPDGEAGDGNRQRFKIARREGPGEPETQPLPIALLGELLRMERQRQRIGCHAGGVPQRMLASPERLLEGVRQAVVLNDADGVGGKRTSKCSVFPPGENACRRVGFGVEQDCGGALGDRRRGADGLDGARQRRGSLCREQRARHHRQPAERSGVHMRVMGLRGGGEVEPEVAAVDPREAAVAVAQAFAAAAR